MRSQEDVVHTLENHFARLEPRYEKCLCLMVCLTSKNFYRSMRQVPCA